MSTPTKDDPNDLPPITLDELETEVENLRDIAQAASADAFVSRFVCENLLLALHNSGAINGNRFITFLRLSCEQLDPRDSNEFDRMSVRRFLDDLEKLLLAHAGRPDKPH